MMEDLLTLAPLMLMNLLGLLAVVVYHAIYGEEIRQRDIEAMGGL